GMGEDCELLVKIHPLERNSWLSSFIQEVQKTYPFLRLVDANIQALLCASDVCVCGYSTVVLEAMFFNTPSIIFAHRPLPEYVPFVSMGAALGASNVEELERALAALLDDTMQKRQVLANHAEFIEYATYRNDGRSTERLCHWLEQLVDRGSQ
ncbi:hypothetical protein LCGC14_2873720, partial [marine sediment metagenome]